LRKAHVKFGTVLRRGTRGVEWSVTNPSSNWLVRRESEWLGDPALLAECLGSPDGLGSLGPAVWSARQQPVEDLASLRAALEQYCSGTLVAVELPVIRRAFHHASRYELREMLELDRSLAAETALSDFAFASQAVGRAFLHRLRPLRDLRLVRRYELAVQTGQAHGWHTIVYGLVLSIYSIPLRQGLVSYARQTLHGFVEAGGSRLRLPVSDLRALADELLTPIPPVVHRLLEPGIRCLPDRSDAV